MHDTRMNSDLIGHWILDPEDEKSISAYGHIMLEFGEKGILTYTILGEKKDQISLMIYEIDDNKLITCQPSHPRKEVTKFSFEENRLKLEFNGVPSWFIRLTEETV